MEPTPFHVLVLDADEVYANSLAAAFAALGARVSLPRDGDAALALARRDPADLLVVSAELPKLSGLVVCNKFKRDGALKLVPVLVITGSTAGTILDEHRDGRTRAEAYAPRETAADELAAKGRTLIGSVKAPTVAPKPPPAPTSKPDPAEELRILDVMIDVKRDARDWPALVALLEQRLAKHPDPTEQLRTLEALLQVHADETLNGPEAVRAAERLLAKAPEHAGAVAALRRAYTRRKDHARLAELDAHLERVRAARQP